MLKVQTTYFQTGSNLTSVNRFQYHFLQGLADIFTHADQ